MATETDSKGATNGAAPAGTYFVGAFGGTAKKSGKDFGRLTVIQVAANGDAQVAEMFCDRDVAERAARMFRVFDPVQLHATNVVNFGRLEARVTEVVAG